jgi:hypothetical protein
MKRFAIISKTDGLVENVVVGEDFESVIAVVGDCIEETETTGIAQIGASWDGSKFIKSEESISMNADDPKS